MGARLLRRADRDPQKISGSALTGGAGDQSPVLLPNYEGMKNGRSHFGR